MTAVQAFYPEWHAYSMPGTSNLGVVEVYVKPKEVPKIISLKCMTTA